MANSETFRVLEGGFKIPTIGLGSVYQEEDDVEQHAIDAALEIGYRHFDTTSWYNTEKNIGIVLNKWLSSGRIKREEIFITTKLPLQGGHAEAVEPFLKKSLGRLQLSHVDLYLIDFPVAFKYEGVNKFTPEPVRTDHILLWKKMEEQVEEGRTKFIGLSNFNISQITKIMEIATIKPVYSQVEMHVYCQNQDHVNFCKDNNIIVSAFFPLGTPNLGQLIDENIRKVIHDPVLQNDAIVRKISEKHNKTPDQILLRFLIQKDVCVTPESSYATRLMEIFQVFNFKLDNEDMNMLGKLDKGEEGRLMKRIMAILFPQLKEHPEYPF